MSETKELIERLNKKSRSAWSLEMEAARALASQAEEIERLKADQPKWESADAVDEGEHLFVYVHDGVAKYGVGIKAWQDADDAKSYVVGNFPWAGMPTHAMKLPAPPSGQNFDDFLAPSLAQLRAKVYADLEAETSRLTRERDKALEAKRELSFDSDRECRASARLACQFARALEALKPFAEIPEADVGTAAHYWVVIGTPDKSHFTREDLRRARSVLQSSSDRKSPDE